MVCINLIVDIFVHFVYNGLGAHFGNLEDEMICIGSDHAAFDMKENIKCFLIEKGYEILDVGTDTKVSVHYPKYGEKVARKVASKECEYGIVICGTGIGVSMAASRVKGIRCAVCSNLYTARLAREHNNANVIALGARVIGDGIAQEMVEIFLTTKFEAGRHAIRVAMLDEIE